MNGGAGEDRTPDLCSASAALSQLSYGPKIWWAILDSNQGPQSYQDCALTS